MPLTLIDARTHPQGAIDVVYGGGSDEDRIIVRAGDLAYELDPVVERLGRNLFLDLLNVTDGAMPAWRLSAPGKGVSLDLDLDPASTLDFTPYLFAAGERSQGAAIAHCDPLTGGATRVAADTRYRLSLRAGIQGGGADILVLLCDEDGEHIDSFRRGVNSRFAGGGEPSAYEDISLEIETPLKAHSLSITVAARPGKGGMRVWLSPPSLSVVGADRRASAPPLRLNQAQLRRLHGERGPSTLSRLRAPLPRELLVPGDQRLRLEILAADGETLSAPLAFRHEPLASLSRHGLERASAVRVAGRLSDPGRASIDLRLVVDGRPSTLRKVKADKGKFDTRLPVGREHLDGRPHLIEVRHEDSQAVLFEVRARTAAYHARWPVLQAYAQSPLSAESSPALARHLSALREWGRRAKAGDAIPPVSRLLEEVLAGPSARPVLPPLAFPDVAKPRASVIVPAHNKVEVTYLCLCSLLFAPCRTPFEVIVVDDGSEDATASLERLVSGVRVVRRAAAGGFIQACRDGAEAAQGEFLVFLNNDTEVSAGWLDALLAPYEDFANVGLTGAKLIYPDGRLQEAGGIVWGSGDPWNYGRGGDVDDPAANYTRVADYLSGAAIATPKTVWDELGGFDPAYAPAYFEDTDYAMKVRASGRRVVYAPQAEVYHYEGYTSGTDKTEGAKRFQEINRPRFKQRWRALYAGRRSVGERPDLEKDRDALFRLVCLVASLDGLDAAGLASLAALQSLGAKVTMLPLDLTWRPAAEALGRTGVETLFAPYARSASRTLAERLADLDAVIIAGDAAAEARILAAAAAPGLAVIELAEITGDDPAARRAAARRALEACDLYGPAEPAFHPLDSPPPTKVRSTRGGRTPSARRPRP